MKNSELEICEELRWPGLLGSKHVTGTKPCETRDHFLKPSLFSLALVLFRDKHHPPIQSNIRKYKKPTYYSEMRYRFYFSKGGRAFQFFIESGVYLNIC